MGEANSGRKLSTTVKTLHALCDGVEDSGEEALTTFKLTLTFAELGSYVENPVLP